MVSFSINFIYLMCDKEYIVGHMAYGQMMFFVFVLFLADYLLDDEIKLFWRKSCALFIIGIMLLMCVLYIRFDNITYVKAEIGQERCINWCNTLVTKIKCTEGYNDDFPIMYVGGNEKGDVSLTDLEDFSFITDTPYYGVETLINDYAFERFMAIWTGFNPEVSYDTESVIHEKKFEDMPCYPDDGSIAVINDVVVVKFSE